MYADETDHPSIAQTLYGHLDGRPYRIFIILKIKYPMVPVSKKHMSFRAAALERRGDPQKEGGNLKWMTLACGPVRSNKFFYSLTRRLPLGGSLRVTAYSSFFSGWKLVCTGILLFFFFLPSLDSRMITAASRAMKAK